MLKKSILWIFVIFISVQIFSFSSATAAQSNSTSKKVTEVVVEVVKKTRSVPKAKKQPCLRHAIKLFGKPHISLSLCCWHFLLQLCAEAIVLICTSH